MRVTSVRRTVTVAVALVVGQALLCGVIGFVTFGGKSEAKPAPHAAEPRLAGPPIVVPPPGVPPPSSSAPARKRSTTRATSTKRPILPPPATSRSTTTATKPPASPVTVPPPSSEPPVSESLPPISLVPTSPAAGDDEPEPPVAGKSCDDEGATGKTAEGKSVRCERDRDGDLRWRLV
ncbi:MAG: hypothetical protein ABW000_19355 [Actinoplanes sp.]